MRARFVDLASETLTEVLRMTLKKTLIGAALGAGVLAVSTMNASAAIVCTGNVCWHTQTDYDYPPAAHVIVHEDTWAPGPTIVFREHEGRGYWRDDRWSEW
jgi:hypothetical protein